MSSKQLYFFLTIDDISEMNKFFGENECIFLRNKISSPELAYCDGLMGAMTPLFQLFITKEAYENDLIFKTYSSSNDYYVDVLQSMVVEFDIGGFYKDDELERSRFYYVRGYYSESGESVVKQPDFVYWADGIFKKFKNRFLKRMKNDGLVYYTDNSLDWITRNNALKSEGGS